MEPNVKPVGNKGVGRWLSVVAAPLMVMCCVFCAKQSLMADSKGGSADSGVDSNVGSSWMELPASENGIRMHGMFYSVKGKRYRNYTIGWSASDHLSKWVAYPLCRVHMKGSSGYSAAWDYNPDVPRKQQPALFRSYTGKDYDRGHQIPSADRQCCTEANSQTFLFTNMTPQLHSFNSGIWESLESNVRHYASQVDTVYVVTGVIMKGSSGNTTDRNGMKCPIPARYYKALLARVRTGNTRVKNYDGWLASAFLLDHRNYGSEDISRKYSLSVRELEKITGMDFFPGLEKMTGSRLYSIIENEKPSDNPFWWQ